MKSYDFNEKPLKHIKLMHECPVCNGQYVMTTDSRLHKNEYRRRRKECMNCGYRYSTIEVNYDCIYKIDELVDKYEDIRKALERLKDGSI